MKRLLCFFGLHLMCRVKWIKHPEGMLGYWHCQTCHAIFKGHIHKLNDSGISAWRIRNVSKKEILSFVKMDLCEKE